MADRVAVGDSTFPWVFMSRSCNGIGNAFLWGNKRQNSTISPNDGLAIVGLPFFSSVKVMGELAWETNYHFFSKEWSAA